MLVREIGKLPFQSIDVRDGDTFEECDDQERNVSRKVVEQNENVVPCSVRKHHTDDAACQANDG